MNWALKPQSIRVTGSELLYTGNQAGSGLEWISVTAGGGMGWYPAPGPNVSESGDSEARARLCGMYTN